MYVAGGQPLPNRRADMYPLVRNLPPLPRRPKERGVKISRSILPGEDDRAANAVKYLTALRQDKQKDKEKEKDDQDRCPTPYDYYDNYDMYQFNVTPYPPLIP